MRKGETFGEKFSTGYNPPEAMRKAADDGKDYQVRSFIVSQNGEQKLDARTQEPILDEQAALLSIDSSFDFWSIGAVAHLLLGHGSLFSTDRDDNLRNAVERKRLGSWDAQSVSGVAESLSLSLRQEGGLSSRRRVAAIDFICWLLQPAPEDRPQSCAELLAHALLSEGDVDEGDDTGGAQESKSSSSSDAVSDVQDDTHTGKFCMPVLHVAAATNDLALIKTELFTTEADVNALDPLLRESALHRAAKEVQVAAVRALLAAPGIEVDALDAFGNTALHAVLHLLAQEDSEEDGLVATVELLFDAQANLELEDDESRSCFDLIRTSKVPAVRTLLDKVVLQALRCRPEPRPFSVEGFEALWGKGDEATCQALQDAVFGLLEEWAFQGHVEGHRKYLKTNVFPLSLWDDEATFKLLTTRAHASMEVVLQELFRIRNAMVDDSEGGKLLVQGGVPSIKGGDAQMTIPVAEACASLGRNSATMRKNVDEEVLVPLVRATANEVMQGHYFAHVRVFFFFNRKQALLLFTLINESLLSLLARF